MKYTGRVLYILLILFALEGGESASGQQIHTYVDRDSVRAGDILYYTLVIEREARQELIVIPDEEAISSQLFQYHERERHSVGELRDSLVYRLQFFGVQDARIPSLQVTLSDSDGDTLTVESSPVPLAFKSLVQEGQEQFRPLKPIFEFAVSHWPWILLLILVLLSAAIFYRWWSSKQNQPEQTATPPSPPPAFSDPLDELREELQILSGEKSLSDRKAIDRFYVRLGDAIRRYIYRVYHIPALEMTSREILQEFREYVVDREMNTACRRVFAQADIVKFARFDPGEKEIVDALETGYQFLKTAEQVDRQKIELMKTAHQQHYNLQEKEDDQ